MADSGAVRQARYKRHRAGDHSMCRHWPQPALISAVPPPEPGDDFDPAEEMRRLAARLVVAHAADPSNAGLAREARMTLLAIASPGEDTELAELMRAFQEGT
jgi:hypothetical protein